MKNIAKKNYRGFYLVEAIIALFLVTAGLLVTVDLITRVTSNSFEDRDSVIAAMLAQEGIELVRNMRDNNFAQGKEAFDIGKFPSLSVHRCRIDKDSTDIRDCGSLVNVDMYKDSNQFYIRSGAVGSYVGFRRRISVVYSTAGGAADTTNYATIISVVTWDNQEIGIFPTNDPTKPISETCKVSEGCTYVQVNLTRWE